MSEVIFPEKLKEIAKPYFFRAEQENITNTLVILVHGFGASATETRPLGEFLCKKGFDIYGVLLTGHGTVSKDMDSLKWKDWFNDIKSVYDDNVEKYNHIFIGGVSLGGALTLYAATQLEFTGIFTINSLYRFSRLIKSVIWILHFFKLHRPRNVERVKWYVENDLFAYQEDSTYAAYQILRMLDVLHRNMDRIKEPALIIQSKEDRTVTPESAEWIYKDLKTSKELLQLPRGDHILTVDEHRYTAFYKIVAFIEKAIIGE